MKTRGYDIGDTFDRRSALRNVRRLVVKVGTSTLSRADQKLDTDYIADMLKQVAGLRDAGLEVVIVTSGAVGAGIGALGLPGRPKDIGELQAVAAVGQSLLMHTYDHAASPVGIRVAQVLMSAVDLRRKSGYRNMQNVFRSLFHLGALPVVNENDSVAVEELKFGDNDSLSAHVANLIDADLLVIFSDIDGLFEGCPREGTDIPLIRTVFCVDSEIERLCGASTSGVGIGGMATKVNAAKMLAASGVPTVIAHGRTAKLAQIVAGDTVGTMFVAGCAPGHTSRHQHWVLAQKTAGRLVVDSGAAKAIIEGNKSLLPSGIRRVTGKFSEGDAVSVVAEKGVEIAKGITRYSADEIRKIARHHSREIATALGYTRGDEVIHRDNLVTVLDGIPRDGQ